MGFLPPSAEKHRLTGIGEASAASLISALAVNPSTAFLTAGVSGKVLFFILSKVFSWAASVGLVLLNVGAESLLVAAEKSEFDGSYDTAAKLIEEIRKTGRDLTPEEIARIDDQVIETFRKFAKITRKQNDKTFDPYTGG